MKLYREVKANGNCLTYYTPRGVPIHLAPIEITEEEIEKMAYEWSGKVAFGSKRTQAKEDFITGAKAILNLLKDKR